MGAESIDPVEWGVVKNIVNTTAKQYDDLNKKVDRNQELVQESFSKVHGKIESSQAETRKALSEITGKIDAFTMSVPCKAHEARLDSQEKDIKALEEKPSAVKAVIMVGSILGVFATIIGILVYIKG